MTTELRNLTQTKLHAALAATAVPSDKAVAETPTAKAATKSYLLPLTCSRTGITVGSVSVATIAGHMPFIGQWRDTMVLHPLFSMRPVALLQFSKNCWFRFCSFSKEEAEDDRLTAKQEETIRVAALCMLYNLAKIRQDMPWMPAWQDVAAHWSSLMALSYWRAKLDSDRFRFPAIHISKLENGFELGAYLQRCWDVKKEYESTVNERIELEKLKRTEDAMVALRDELAGVVPNSHRQVWRWVLAHLPKRYAPDTEGWMKTLYFAKGDAIRDFTIADIDLFEQIVMCEVPTGSSISHNFFKYLDTKRSVLQQHVDTFEILIPQQIVDSKAAGEISAVEPRVTDFPNKVAYLVAHAKWKLAYPTPFAASISLADQQKVRTVKASYIPELPDWGDSEEDEDVIDVVDAISEAANTGENDE